MDGPKVVEKMGGNKRVPLDCSVTGVPKPEIIWMKVLCLQIVPKEQIIKLPYIFRMASS